jgi:hypothetical protein
MKTNCEHPELLRVGKSVCSVCKEHVTFACRQDGEAIWYLRGVNRYHVPFMAKLFVSLHEACKAVKACMKEADRGYTSYKG